MRYHIADEGGLVGFDQMLEFCLKYGHDPLAEVREQHGQNGQRGAPQLPFAYVFGRSLFTVSYFGANIYPENVTVALESPSISDWVTGKFVLETAETTDRDRELRVTVELAPGQSGSPERAEALAEAIRAKSRRLDGEFTARLPEESQLPVIEVAPGRRPRVLPTRHQHRYTRPTP